jgi:hypothetical protein
MEAGFKEDDAESVGVFLDLGAVPFDLYGLAEFSTILWTLRPKVPHERLFVTPFS